MSIPRKRGIEKVAQSRLSAIPGKTPIPFIPGKLSGLTKGGKSNTMRSRNVLETREDLK
jgi:hypothetical protein